MITKTEDLPEEYKRYILEVRANPNRHFTITGIEKKKIETSTTSFISLKNDTINRTAIIGIFFSPELTGASFKELDPELKTQILEGKQIMKSN